jgi:6-phosphogluconolactonase
VWTDRVENHVHPNACYIRSDVEFERVVAPPAELALVFAERFQRARRASDRHRFSLVLPGGSVAETFFPTLAGADIDWSSIDLFWGDERAVPSDDPQSNYYLAHKLLLSQVDIDRDRVHRMPADGSDLERAARDYEIEIVRTLGESPRFDVVLLGVGPDGHVCSLFPEHPALRVTSRLVVAVNDSPKPPPSRLTLTLAALAGTDIFVAAFGKSKAAVVREALEEPASLLPVALAARAARTATSLLDSAAASDLAAID